ncbi:MAG: helix-turn-helix domain-containing protein [Bacteroidota bacterium]
MRTASPAQFLLNLSSEDSPALTSSFLKDLTRSLDIHDFEAVDKFLLNELANSSIQSSEQATYFFFLANEALMYFFSRKDGAAFGEAIEVIPHRLIPLRANDQLQVEAKTWEIYLEFLRVAFGRLLKQLPLETFEHEIDQLDWSLFDQKFIASISTVIGLVYVHEEQNDQRSRARLWLQKSAYEQDTRYNLANYLYLGAYYLSNPDEDCEIKLDELIEVIATKKANLERETDKHLFDLAALELKLHRLAFNMPLSGNEAPFETGERLLAEGLQSFEALVTKDSPRFFKANLQLALAKLSAADFTYTEDELERQQVADLSISYCDTAIEEIEGVNDLLAGFDARLTKAEMAVNLGHNLTEKEIREVAQHYKRKRLFPQYIQANEVYGRLLVRNNNSSKLYDLLLDILKFATKRLEDGGFYLFLRAFEMSNTFFQEEVRKPGVSWLVEMLEPYFERLTDILDQLPDRLEEIGKYLINLIREVFYDFEPVSHFNIKVYFLYQLYEVKMMRLGMLVSGDEIGLRQANRLLKELETPNNPLYFMSAGWDDFKKVPNDVRNKTLNKCIDISKGDLPLAAEHLDFSYRNLRSYITFKEVNRLGFFLDLHQTNNRQLEQGIRYMFFDLYKQGTIFEVVFDMPKFLVEHAQSGFYSQDLEESLKIKGTTAKKYLKIMAEVGLIRQDKTTGRKHYYRLIRENVMNRLGQDQSTLIKSD